MTTSDNSIAPEQLVYASWLDWGTRIGMALLIASFVAYAANLAAPHVPFERLAQIWSLPVDQYRAAASVPAGWGWLALAGHGDYLNYFGIIFLALVTLCCYLRMLPMMLSRGDRLYALVVAVEIVVLAAAASGLLGASH